MGKLHKLETNAKISIDSLGGVGDTVTGSSHLLILDGRKYLIDCGMFQGKNDMLTPLGRNRNSQKYRDWLFGLSHVIVTHSHIDHSGNLPVLIREGLRPTIWMTDVTEAIAPILINNSADIQDELPASERHFDHGDVEQTVKRFVGVDFNTDFFLDQRNNDGVIQARFIHNGHVPGSAAVMLTGSEGQTILFSGDVGRPYQPLGGGYKELNGKYPDRPIRHLIVDSTNVEATPVSFEDKKETLMSSFNRTWRNGGNVLLPVLSFDRCQAVLEMLGNLQKTGQIPADVKIYLDAPLAVEILEVYKSLAKDTLTRRFGDDPNYYTQKSSMERFDLKNLVIVGSHKESVALDLKLAYTKDKVIILAGGGMGVMGRSANYIRGKFGTNPKNLVEFNCYLVDKTLGRGLANRGYVGYDERNPGAKVEYALGWTTHAMGLEEWWGFYGKFDLSEVNTVLIVHGSQSAKNLVASELKRRGIGATIILPEIGQRYTLN